MTAKEWRGKLFPLKAIVNERWNLMAHEIVADLERTEQKLAWVEDVRNSKPDHPDDERGWCGAYLTFRERAEKAEKALKEAREALRSAPTHHHDMCSTPWSADECDCGVGAWRRKYASALKED